MIELVLVPAKNKGVADETVLKNYVDYCDDLAGVEFNIEKAPVFFGIFKESFAANFEADEAILKNMKRSLLPRRTWSALLVSTSQCRY